MTIEQRAKATATKVITWCMQREQSSKKEDNDGAVHFIQEALEEERGEMLDKVRAAEELAELMAWNDYKRGRREVIKKAWYWQIGHKNATCSYDDFRKAMEE